MGNQLKKLAMLAGEEQHRDSGIAGLFVSSRSICCGYTTVPLGELAWFWDDNKPTLPGLAHVQINPS